MDINVLKLTAKRQKNFYKQGLIYKSNLGISNVSTPTGKFFFNLCEGVFGLEVNKTSNRLLTLKSKLDINLLF